MLHIKTPLIESLSIPQKPQQKVWLKLENCQPSGSFKARGVGFACEHYVGNGATHLFASSGGNAGLAVAYSGRVLNVSVTVVVPKTTKQKAIDLIEQEGAEVIIHGNIWADAHQHALTLMCKNSAYIHPYDDPLLWEGHATMIDEMVEQNVVPDAVVVSVGGGGLMLGVSEGLKRNNLNQVPIIAVETEGADSFANALKHNKRSSLSTISSVATSLGATQVAEAAFALGKTAMIKSIVVSDKAAIRACSRFLNEQRMLVEPACGASLSAVYNINEFELMDYKNIVVIVCGGVGVTLEQLNSWKKQFQID